MNTDLGKQAEMVHGYLREIEGESFYCIENYHLMPPFFMSVVSSSDLWMYISSNGSLTAGRQNYNNTLFPYYTDDKIHESAENTGPKTLFRIKKDNTFILWEPFSDKHHDSSQIRRNLFKNTAGNKIIFEEINPALQLRFRYSWMSSDRLGWIRECRLENLSGEPVALDITDGLQNVLPYGIARETQSMMSTLMDAYKVAEQSREVNMALFYLSSIPVDRAEPSEALRANTIWYSGLNAKKVLLSSKQLNRLRQGLDIENELRVCGEKTSFFLHQETKLLQSHPLTWYLVADVGLDSSDVISLQHLVKEEEKPELLIRSSVEKSSARLHRLVRLADGIQETGDPMNDRRHFANVMFNIMRGGIFENEYNIDIADYKKHIESSNKLIYGNHKKALDGLPSFENLDNLLQTIRAVGNPDLMRLTLEYLPLSFSRRHGDPSRPWNFFDIVVKKPDGSPSLNYQGNWRDIFQNWEALAFSFPGFIPGMLSRFLNASTADGYNPYRITRQGFDWEVPEPDNPWAYIGYWGDHQVVYLLRLLELQESFFPGQMEQMFQGKIFAYARVPYRIKGYTSILENPRDTILFDKELHDSLTRKSLELGADGKLMHREGELVRASFSEKLLVMVLTKLSNFIPGAGIWLNTQRPEWNDANNALVGNGTSVVTLCHLRRFCSFFEKLLEKAFPPEIELAAEVHDFWHAINEIFSSHSHLLETGFDGSKRKSIADLLGNAGEQYREKVYGGFSGDLETVKKDSIREFLQMILKFTDQTLDANHRNDGLVHSYKLLDFKTGSLEVQQLYLMLEGQVAYLSSGLASPEETLRIMKALFESKLFREDQQSFMLYPFRKLPGFLEKNTIPGELAGQSKLLIKLLENDHNPIIRQDCEGNYHFNANLKNARLLEEALQQLPIEANARWFEQEKALILNIYESVFNHRCFTGRSGSFYKYEGLGSIYWHMVSKLLLALGENIIEFSADEKNQLYVDHLKSYYFRVREGIGAHKPPPDYGAFPTDPYSHTPAAMGAQQPGMTGQVKEDIRSRFNELGIVIQNACIKIDPVLLRNEDFNDNTPPELRFTFCNAHFVYRKTGQNHIEVFRKSLNEKPYVISDRVIPQEISKQVFDRDQDIEKIIVHLE
jgi:hypothetical protein